MGIREVFGSRSFCDFSLSVVVNYVACSPRVKFIGNLIELGVAELCHGELNESCILHS